MSTGQINAAAAITASEIQQRTSSAEVRLLATCVIRLARVNSEQLVIIDGLRAQNAIQAEQLDRLADAVPSAGAWVK